MDHGWMSVIFCEVLDVVNRWTFSSLRECFSVRVARCFARGSVLEFDIWVRACTMRR
jgi:hypothetical protein